MQKTTVFDKKETLIRLAGPGFCAGCIIRNGVAVRCAPYLKRLRGLTVQAIQTYARRQRLEFMIVESE